MDLASARGPSLWLANSSSSSRCGSTVRPPSSAVRNAFTVGERRGANRSPDDAATDDPDRKTRAVPFSLGTSLGRRVRQHQWLHQAAQKNAVAIADATVGA